MFVSPFPGPRRRDVPGRPFGGPVAMWLGVGGSWSTVGEFGWGEFVVGGVGSVGVVVAAPVFDDHAGFEQRVELPRVEQFVAWPAVERLDPGVLPRRAGIDE